MCRACRQTFGDGRLALKFGQQKINIHEAGHKIDPKVDRPTPDSADLCLLVEDSLDNVVAALHEHHVTILVRSIGPARMGPSPLCTSGTPIGT